MPRTSRTLRSSTAARSSGSPAARRPRSRTSATSPNVSSRSPARPTLPRMRRSWPRRPSQRPRPRPAGRGRFRHSPTTKAPRPRPAPRNSMPSRALAALPVLAIVGRPNVGKSTIFNRFVGKRQAIVEDRARTTRDRMYGDMEWNGRRFVIVDTGGLEVDTDDPIEIRVQEQARLAIREADVILFVVDAVSGMTPADQEAAELLRTAKAPLIVAVNKVDNTQREADAAEFWSMGWEETYSISASHGRGTGDLLDAIVWALPPETEAELARQKREDEADEWAREVDAGRLEPYVVGDLGNAVDPTEDEEAEEAELDRFEGGQAAGGEI